MLKDGVKQASLLFMGDKLDYMLEYIIRNYKSKYW